MKRREFIVATNNKNKLIEIMDELERCGCTGISLEQAGIHDDPEETGSTLEENAYIKAKAAFDIAKKPVIADDTGLFVDALGGEPGINSARYAGNHNYAANNEKLLKCLEGVPLEKRTARFACAVTAMLENGESVTATGVVEGRILEKQRGEGFGYEPVFLMWNNNTMAEITNRRKNEIAHRGRALRKLLFKLRGVKRIRSKYDK